jgi:hypothetical protein
MRQKLALVAAIVCMVLAGLPLAHAQSGEGYDLTWNTVDNGGASFSTGDGYQLGGTIGQPDAGVLSGGDYTFVGGFWGGVGPVSAALEHAVYLPCLLRGFASVSQ